MEATLQQILDAREQRCARQRSLLHRYRMPLICFTMNIAGPEKCSPLILRGFRLGLSRLEAQLKAAAFPIAHFEQEESITGCQAFYVVDAPAVTLKQLTCEIEDMDPVGRLFDMDVLDTDARKIQRQALGLPSRRCLLCREDALVCGRSRAHSVQALQAETTRLLKQALDQEDAQAIGSLAVKSLLYEVCVTPKPGLVDRTNSGSHRDMDIFTFLDSACALIPYFRHCAEIGIHTRILPEKETFRQLRLAGKLAELEMLRATGCVNTHKGAIFTLGLLCGAAGRLENRSPAAVCAACAAMTQGILAEDFQSITPETAKTAGQRLYALHGITGIRGQAEQGFPAVLEAGLPALKKGIEAGLSVNDAGCGALLAILATATDTNLIARSDLQTQQQIQSQIAAMLQDTPFPEKTALEALDKEFIQKNLSAGGSADLLAASYFLYFLSGLTNL